jgi:hypothetical protein
MPESEEDNQDFPPKTKTSLEEHVSAMDFDLDLETSWPLDHMSFISNPMSPFLFSTIPLEKMKIMPSLQLQLSPIATRSSLVCFVLFLLDWFYVDFSFLLN